VKKFSFWKKKKRKKFYFFIDFLSNNPIHNLKGIIKFLEKMGFQLIGGEGGYGISEKSKQSSNEKGHRLV